MAEVQSYPPFSLFRGGGRNRSRLISVLQENAREEVLHNAQIMGGAAKAAAAYTVTEVRPLLMPDMKHPFVPQAVSFYAARRSFELLRTAEPEYTYRIASLNPTNPSNRAFDWEADIIRDFRDNPDRKQILVERDTPTGPVLSLFQPVTVYDKGCSRVTTRHRMPPNSWSRPMELRTASAGS